MDVYLRRDKVRDWLLRGCLMMAGFMTVQTNDAAGGGSDSGLAGQRQFLGKTLTTKEMNRAMGEKDRPSRWRPYPMNLAPARWIWLPSQRTLPNTFVLFRKEINLDAPPTRAIAWLTADSRYRLTVNGKRVQWGPAPCDPRNLDVDPADLTPFLRTGRNVIGVEVLHYGVGDGTWAAGKPGFIFNATIEQQGGQTERIISDGSWSARLDRAHRPGQYKRWFLRSLQEEFDARLHPCGWDTAEFKPDEQWVSAAVINCPSDKPSSCAHYDGNDLIDRADPARSSLRAREIPPLRENEVLAMRLADSGRVDWLRDPADWFEFRMPESFKITREPVASERGQSAWELPATKDARHGVFATFEFKDQIVGWPHFIIDAPDGTIVELMVQESHSPTGPAWMDTHFFAWTRFVCREGVNRFEVFDYESLRWLQLHVHNATRPVIVREVGVRRRQYDWPHAPQVHCSEPALQRLFDATINTLHNSAQEHVVDGMGRERQQYSGDCGPQLYALRYAFGETRLPRRFLRTFSEGLTPNGYFLDCWPAFDRLARVMQKQIDGAYWGPLLDHGVGFNFDCWSHYLETGDLEAIAEPYPRLLRFAEYLESIRDKDGLLPVENLGIPAVWIDHDAYQKQRHKQCAFNLYAAAMFEHALAPMARAFGETGRAARFVELGRKILDAAVRRFWSPERCLFVNNLPWLAEEENPRLCDRSLATSILFDQCPNGNTATALQALADRPSDMGLSYPANAYWRYWALAKLGRVDVILKEFRGVWARMPSVVLNNTLQECWTVRPDSKDEWSHCPVSPVFVLFMDIAGIRPTAPGFARCQVRPQLADLGNLDLTAHTVRGPIRFIAEAQAKGHCVSLSLPVGCEGELLLPKVAGIDLEVLAPDHPTGLKRFRLKSGATNVFVTGSD
jgi:alpha-L-rhamnosidase